MNHFPKVPFLDFVFDILAMFEKLNQSECYKSKICVSSFFHSSCTNASDLSCAARTWPQRLFSVRQPFNQCTICCAKLLIPSETTRMLTLCFFLCSASDRPHYTLRACLQCWGGEAHGESLHHQRGRDPGAHLSGDGASSTTGKELGAFFVCP